MSKPNDPTNTRYKPLADHLANLGGKPITITLSDIEEILGNPLPDTARGDKRQQWWGNDPTHTQANNGWMKAGYSTVNAAETLPDAISFVQTTSSEKAYSFDELSKLFHKHFRMSNRNYREVAVRTLLDAADLTDVKGKQIKENIKKLNSILPPELQGQNDVGVALEMCREPQGKRVGIEYNSKKDSYSLALSKDATEEQKKELKGICGRYIAKLHIDLQNPSGSGA